MYKLCRLLLIAFVAVCGYCLCLSLAVFGGVILFFLALSVVAWAARRKKELSAYGTARFAKEDELERAGMTAGQGLLVGTLLESQRPSIPSATLAVFNPRVASDVACKRFLRAIFPGIDKTPTRVRLSTAVHTAVIAPTGVGKGVSCVVPFLLECTDSCVVVDFKGENALLTMKRRRQMGHRVVLLDPYRMVTADPDCLNPLDFIDKESPHVIDEIRDLAESLVIRTGQEREPHWNDSAETWIAAAIAAVVEHGDADDRSLQTVRDLLASGPDKLDIMAKLLCESQGCGGMLARLGYQLTQFKDKELASTLTTTNRFLRHLDTLAVLASTKTSTFNPGGLLAGKMTVYLVLPPEHARAQSPLLRTWITALLRAVLRGGLQERNRVHFLLDEAASLGHLDCLDDAVDKYRGYGVRLTFIYQSLGQLKKCFPEGQDQTLLSNVTQVFFGVNDLQTAEYISNRLGDATIVVTSGSTSRGTTRNHSYRDSGSYSTSWNQTESWQQLGRKLLKPDEVMAMSQRTAISFVPGLYPVATQLIRYYEDRPESALRKSLQAMRMMFGSALLLAAAMLLATTLEESRERRFHHPPAPVAFPHRRMR
jgi:type IV secretion system protein VirD4